MNTDVSPIGRLIESFGGLTKTAAALGIDNPSVIANWRTRGSVPADRVLEIETTTGISRHELRPDIFGASPTPAAQGAEA